MGGTAIKHKKSILAIIVVFFLLLSTPNQIISAKAIDQEDMKNVGDISGNTTSSGGSLRYFLGKILAFIIPINQFLAMAAKAQPEVIDIGYGENVTIDVGLMDVETGEFDTRGVPFFLNARSINFEVLEYPGGNADGSWLVSFDPPVIRPKNGEEIKSQLTISLTAPSNPKNAIKSGILKIKLKDTQAYGNLWFPPELPLFQRLLWSTSAIFTMRFGKYSGTVDTEERIIEILVRVKPYHTVRFEATPLIKLNPGEIASIPISLQNLGNYNDTYGFRVVSDYKGIKISNPVSVTLKPGERKDTLLGVAVSPNVLDMGTLYTVRIETYSIDQSNVTIAQRTVFLETRGLYVSELGWAGVLLFCVIIIFAVAFFLHRHRKISIKFHKKPEKPWDIPEKKEYLEELRKEDRKKYNTVLDEMRKEYRSSILSYNSSRKAMLKEARKIKTKESEKEKQQTPDIKKTKEIKTKESKPELPQKEEKRKSVIEKSAEMEKQRREQAILKIKKAQEKQRRKFGK